jgi:hypothetical protein
MYSGIAICPQVTEYWKCFSKGARVEGLLVRTEIPSAISRIAWHSSVCSCRESSILESVRRFGLFSPLSNRREKDEVRIATHSNGITGTTAKHIYSNVESIPVATLIRSEIADCSSPRDCLISPLSSLALSLRTSPSSCSICRNFSPIS